jgi:hypothetical protein
MAQVQLQQQQRRQLVVTPADWQAFTTTVKAGAFGLR